MQEPKAQEIYRHFKGSMYQIVTIAQHSETGEKLVIYQALYGDGKVYARPLEMFMSKVDRKKYPNAVQLHRFEKVVTEAEKAAEAAAVADAAEETAASEGVLPPLVEQFFDSKESDERLALLVEYKDQITDEMLAMMALACEVELPEGGFERKYASLCKCLEMWDKYEGTRLRSRY